MNFILITKDIDIANFSLKNGVNFIMCDLEYIGKKKRQINFDTVLNSHTIDDVKNLSKSIESKNFIVRINPLHNNSEKEINEVLKYNPGYIMLPMFKSVEDLRFVLNIINNRSKLIPLIENPTCFMKTEDYLDLKNIGFFYFGLNDINIGMDNDFLFEALAYDLLKPYFNMLKNKKLPFGFGGMATLEGGELPGKYVFSEHIRNGSDYVILSRAFHKNSNDIKEIRKNVDIKNEISNILKYEKFLKINQERVLSNNLKLKKIVKKIVNSSLVDNYKKK